MFNTEISILLNTEKIPILKFNNTEIFGINTENIEGSDELNFWNKLEKIWEFFVWKFFFKIICIFRYSSVFSGISRYFSGFNTENVWYWKKNRKKSSEIFFEFFFFRNFSGLITECWKNPSWLEKYGSFLFQKPS